MSTGTSTHLQIMFYEPPVTSRDVAAFMVKDVITGEPFIADHLLTQSLEKLIADPKCEADKKAEYEEVIRQVSVIERDRSRCSTCITFCSRSFFLFFSSAMAAFTSNSGRESCFNCLTTSPCSMQRELTLERIADRAS